jgi:hypothetical protein
MCFKNLPIEFDFAGQATLRQGVADPYRVTVAEPSSYVRRVPNWRHPPGCGTGTSTR